MNKNSDVYLTKYSLSKLSKKINLIDFSNLMRTFLDIDIDLTQYFNGQELISMNKVNMLCNSYIDECVRHHIETSTKHEKNYKERLIYPRQPPSFHYTDDCEFLNSDYENFEIPVEIKYEDIEEYRKFFLENIDLYKANKLYFFARVEMKFKESTLQALGAKPCKACLRQSNLLMA